MIPAAVERVCPVLAGAGLLHGRTLSLRTPTALREVKAPARFLRSLHDWCDGQSTLADLRDRAHAKWGGAEADRWMAFVADLLDAGVLVDAARLLPDAARYADHPSPWGYAAPRAEWPAIRDAIAHSWNSGAPWPGEDPTAAAPALASLLRRRHSSRGFAIDGSVASGSVDALCWALTGCVDADAGERRRTHPSAGGFYPLRVRLLVLRACDGWAPGVHEIGIGTDGALLRRTGVPVPAQWLRAFLQPHRLVGAVGVVMLAADLREPARKYRNRSYPYALIEAGAALQNAALACAETGLGFHVFGGYDDRALAGLCALPANEQILACALFGAQQPHGPASRRLAFDFRWAAIDERTPFHVARVELDDPRAVGRSAWGRDSDPQLAAARALGEAVERLAYRRPRDLHKSTAVELERIVAPELLAGYSPRQLNAPGFPFERFDPAARRLWTPVQRHGAKDESCWVPAEFVFRADALPPSPTGRLLTRCTSSGCATHPDIEVARSNALCELVERDAFMRHWLAQRPGTPLPRVAWPNAIASRARALEADGCNVRIVLLEGEFPVWLVGLRSEAGGFQCVGAGAGWDRSAALERAFTEAETAARIRSSEPCRAISPSAVICSRDHADLFAQRRYFRRADVLFGSDEGGALPHASHWPASLAEGVARLAERDREVFFADLSLADAPLGFDGRPLHTVRALVPGLVPIAFGQAPLPLGLVRATARGRFPHPFP